MWHGVVVVDVETGKNADGERPQGRGIKGWT